MEMHQVRYFLAVCRTLNFTKAAEECNVAQPSLTRAVQKLEEELGGPLFHRERANTHLTELGRLMLPHLEQAYGAAQAAKSLATSVKKGEVAPLKLAIDTTVSVTPVIEILSNLCASIKGVVLTLGSGTRREMIEHALEGNFDLVIASQVGEAPDRMRTWVLFREQCVVVVRKDHRFAKMKSVAISEFDNEPMVARMDCCLASVFEEACKAAGIKPNVRHCAAGEDQIQQMVHAGFGCSVFSPTTVLIDGLIGVPIVGGSIERQVVLGTIAGRRFSPAADAFMKIARARDWSERISSGA